MDGIGVKHRDWNGVWGRRMQRIFLPWMAFLAGALPVFGQGPSGVAIYEKHCASCHGASGEGVEEECEDPLQGERSLASLTRYIEKRMPEEDPHLVVGEDAKAVAEYIFGAFYSPAARAGQVAEVRPAFARLTNRQFRESVADLLGSFSGVSHPGEGKGLQARYFQSDGMNKKAKQVLEREDRALSFDFGEGPPVEGIAADQFSIEWQGSLIAPATGWYEFKLSTPNGARFYLNMEAEEGDGNHRDDSGAKRQTALIDSWVSSGAEVRESVARVFLLGGRAYPFKLDYFKYKEAKGMVRLDWKMPRGEWAVMAAPYLSPAWAGRVAVVSTNFPPDDASEGYERGTEISKAWHEASTQAALEISGEVVARLAKLSGVPENDPDRVNRLKGFIATFAERAFRRPLGDAERQLYVERPFADGMEADQAVKRAVISILKSPRFLYPELGGETSDFTVATRLALGLWDSLPDQALIDAAKAGQLRNAEQVRAQAWRLMSDPRARAKVNDFFFRWLKLDVEGDLRKNPESFPGFDAVVVADLRRSLELFVDRVVWSEASDYRELIQADYLLLNERLSSFYGLPFPGGEGFQVVKCDPAQRSGVLTHPYLLARLAHHDTTSPIHRGVFLTRHVLGGVLKAPPEAIAFENQHFEPGLTTREKVAELTRNASCMTCHETINPLGFSLENFDAVGRFRTTEGEKPVNAESDYLTIEGDVIRLRGPRDVAGHAVTSEAARRGFIRQLFQFIVKQNPAVYGPGTIENLDGSFMQSGHHLRNLIVELNTLAALRGKKP
jgi:mono/diheme cytochrome c family protein